MTSIDDQAQGDALQHEAHGWVVRLTSGTATVADAEALQGWLRQSPAHEQAFRQANALWDEIGFAGRGAVPSSPVAINRAEPFVGSPLIGRRAVLTGAIAASAAGILITRPPFDLWPSWSELASDYRTGVGGRKQVSVAGSVLDMNTRTSLAVQSMQGEGAVKLIAGEVAIAAHSESFTVLASDGRTLGHAARFNVRLDDEAVCVTCLGGEVLVEYRNRRARVRDGQQVRYGDRALTEAAMVDPAIVTAWYRGMLVFHNEPLARVVDEVNRYRPGKVVLLDQALGRRQIEASFRLDRIDDVIALVRDAYGARVTRLPGGLVLLS